MFFFFKQKTAYELRISDWSSDVCSSDLHAARSSRNTGKPPAELNHDERQVCCADGHRALVRPFPRGSTCPVRPSESQRSRAGPPVHPTIHHKRRPSSRDCRSEEHTSELQSLMRISYAVIRLKKKKNNTR